jgi:hypothetical protein
MLLWLRQQTLMAQRPRTRVIQIRSQAPLSRFLVEVPSLLVFRGRYFGDILLPKLRQFICKRQALSYLSRRGIMQSGCANPISSIRKQTSAMRLFPLQPGILGFLIGFAAGFLMYAPNEASTVAVIGVIGAGVLLGIANRHWVADVLSLIPASVAGALCGLTTILWKRDPTAHNPALHVGPDHPTSDDHGHCGVHPDARGHAGCEISGRKSEGFLVDLRAGRDHFGSRSLFDVSSPCQQVMALGLG